MNVEENIAVGLRIKGHSKDEIEKRVNEVAGLLEITDLLKRMPKSLSGGQRQRVALARAIAKRPKVFLLDEPLSNLDALLRERMRTELKMLFNKLKATVIYVTHDQAEAMSLSDRIALIDRGRLNQIGSSDMLYVHPNNLFVASFLGSPRINTFEVSIEDKDFVFNNIHFEVPQRYLSKLKAINKLILGIHPEDITVYLGPRQNAFLAQLMVIEKMAKSAILNLNWQERTLKAIVERDFIDRIERNSVWIEFNKERLYFFDVVTQELL